MSYALISIIDLIFRILTLLILVDVIGSWILAARTQLPDVVYRILALVHSITTPIMEPIRRIIPPLGGLDMSPIIALIALQVLQRLLQSLMMGIR